MLAKRALHASLSEECKRLEGYRDALLQKPKPVRGGRVLEFAARRAGKHNFACRSPGAERSTFRGDDGVDESFLSLIKASSVFDGEQRIQPTLG